MYNEEQKKRFINDVAPESIKVIRVYNTLFEATEKFEENWDADICTRTKEELSPVLEQITGLRVQSRWLRVGILKKYVNWCKINNIEGVCDDILTMEISGLYKVKTQLVGNPTQLDKYLDEIFEPVDDETVDIIYRCYFWLAYAGMQEADMMEVKCSDVNLSKMKVTYKGSEYEIYKEAYNAFKKCLELNMFTIKHPNYTKKAYIDRAGGDLLLRGVKGNVSVYSIRSRISRATKQKIESGETKVRLTHFRAWISGVFYRVRLLELAGMEPDFSGVVHQKMDGKEYKINPKSHVTLEHKKTRKEFEFLEDYQRWKVAFDV